MAAQDPTVSKESNGSAMVVTAYVMLALSWISVGLRTYVRGFLTKGFMADDWWMLAAQANFTISCAFILRGVYYGLGNHNKALDVFDEINALKYQALATATYVLNMCLIKMSIALFLLRIAVQRRYKWTLYISIAVVGIWSLVLFFWNIFQCNPVEAQWDYTILANDPTAHCVSADEVINAAYALSVMTILSDWFYALLPIPMVWNVKMTTQAKMTVMLVLGLGIFASVATLVRLRFLSDLTDVSDLLYVGTDSMVWTLIEPGIAITASSLATIRPLLRAWMITGFQSTEESKSGFRSGKMTSRTNQSNKMPAFGSADVTLVDVEAGNSKTGADSAIWSSKGQRLRGSYMAKVPEAPENDNAITPVATQHHRLSSGFQRIDTRRDAGPYEQLEPTPRSTQGKTWLASDQDSTNSSTIELNQLPPQHQADLPNGIWSPPRN